MSLFNEDRIFSLQQTNLTYGPQINNVQTEQLKEHIYTFIFSNNFLKCLGNPLPRIKIF